MSHHEYDGLSITLERYGEIVTGVLEGSHYGPHYNAHWTNSSGQNYVGLVTKEELNKAIEENLRDNV